jgi:hypothetical protein
MPTTTNTIALWTLATAVDPATFRINIRTTSPTAKSLCQTSLPPATAELA